MESPNIFISKKNDIPEHIDKLMEVVNIKGWIMLVAVGLFAVSALLWGIFGEIPKEEKMEGILIKEGGIGSICNSFEGQIRDLKVSVGDKVKKGECIGIIERPDLVQKIIGEMDNLKKVESSGDKALINEEQKKIKKLQSQLKYESSIISQYDGKIIEIKEKVGDIIKEGQSLMSLEIEGSNYKELIAVFYVNADKTGDLKIGDEVKINPVNIKADEYGYLLGDITSISEYPLTKDAMTHTIGNEEWVSKFMKSGSPIEIKVDLIPMKDNKVSSNIKDKKSVVINETGYEWTMDKEHNFKLQSGTMIKGSVVISKESPIHKILNSGGGSH
jgi:biotin carboxyl carrier protein